MIVVIDQNIFTPEQLESLSLHPEIDRRFNGTVWTIYQEGDAVPEYPEPVPAPDWVGLANDMFYSSLFPKLKEANPIIYSTVLKIITNGENGRASENVFLLMFNELEVQWTQEDKDQINEILINNHFTISI